MALKEKLIDKAQKLIQKGYYDKAIAEYRSAAEADPRDISIRLRIGDLYVKLGKKPEAVKEYTEAARANAQRGFYLKAIAVYKQVLKLEDTLEVHNKLAELYTKQRLIADAISEYSYIVAWFERRGKTSEVLDLLKKMVEVDPNNIGVRLKLAELYQRLSFDKDALAEYSFIFDRLVQQGKLDKAEKVYLGLYNSNPADEKIITGLAELYRLKGDTFQQTRFLKLLFEYYKGSARSDEARETAEKIIGIKPADAEAAGFLKKLKKDEEKPVEIPVEAVSAPQAEAAPPVTGEPALISWPEEELEISVEGFEESDQPANAVLEQVDVPVAEQEPDVQAETETSSGEIEIELEDLLKGELPLMEAEGTPEAAPAGEPPLEEAPEIEIEFELHVEAAPVEDVAPQEDAAPVVAAQEEVLPEAEVKEPLQDAAEEIFSEQEPKAPYAIEIEAFNPQEAEPEVVEESAEVEAVEAVPLLAEEEHSAPVEEVAQPEPVASPEIEFELISNEPPPVESEEAAQAESPQIEALESMVEEGMSPSGVLDSTEPVPAEDIKEDLKAIEEEPLPEEKGEDLGFQTEESLEDLSSAIDELMEKIEPAPHEAAEPAGSVAEEYVDLSAELGMEEALKDLAGPWGGNESRETFDEFKTGIGQQLSKEDSETHYNLGIAYMEMELFAEASKEFKIALKDPRLEFDCYSRLGLCSMAMDEPQEAVGYYLKGIKVEGRSIEERIGMMYELGLAYEAAGETEESEEIFKGIYELAPSFREIASKVNESMSHRPMVPLDDGLIEVELL